METLDFTFERREELIKKSYFNDGLNQGVSKGKNDTIEVLRKVKKDELSLEDAANWLNISVMELKELR